MQKTVTTGCKINIGLNIVGKRPDGYHNLQTIFYPIPLLDRITLTEATEDSIDLSGHPLDGDPQDNLVMKAVRLLRENGCPVPTLHISLEKNIPSGAGLGGGSSDASCVVTTLNEMYHYGLTTHEMERMVAQLGADCPFFIQNKPVFAEGIGDVFSPTDINLQGLWLVLVKPDDHISTREAYSQVQPFMPDTSVNQFVKSDIETWKDTIVNDFEKSVFTNHSVVRDIKEKLYQLGAVYASMSGSGSSVFGLFRNNPTINNVFNEHFLFVCKL